MYRLYKTRVQIGNLGNQDSTQLNGHALVFDTQKLKSKTLSQDGESVRQNWALHCHQKMGVFLHAVNTRTILTGPSGH